MRSVLALIPIAPDAHPLLADRIRTIAALLPSGNPGLRIDVAFDERPEPKQPGDSRPWSKVARVRNRMLRTTPWPTYDYVLWIDSDIMQIPPDLPTRLVESADGGIAAPLVLVEGTDTFYDWAAFVQAGRSHIEPGNRWKVPGRNLAQEPPYWDVEPAEDVVPMDCVGACYLASTAIYRTGVAHEDHPAFTDHYPICAKAREMGLPVVCDRRLRVYHADLEKYGIPWH